MGLLCAVAAMGAVAAAPAAPHKPVSAVVAPAMTIAAAVAVALSDDADFHDDAGVEIPLSALAIWRSPEKARGPDFEIGGLGVNFAAYKPKLRTDAFGPAGLRSDSGAMGKAMPGYPQPARLVVGVKVAF